MTREVFELVAAAEAVLAIRLAQGVDDSSYFLRLEKAVSQVSCGIPDLDHSLLSPSGKVSRRAKRAALKRFSQNYETAESGRIARLQTIAKGMPDLPSTQAAKRLLENRR